MTTFSVKQRIDGALNKLGIQKRPYAEIRQMAKDWHRERHPELPENVAVLPGYKAGAKASEHWHEIEAAIQAAMMPDISKMTTYIKPKKTPTSPLVARDITYQNTPQSTGEIDQIATLKNNPATPTPEVRAALFAEDVPNVAETLILWEPDPDATDRRVIVRRNGPRNTINIPAMPAEMLLLEVMRKDTHEQSTGENERLPMPENWML